MKQHYILSTYQITLAKFQKFQSRLQRHIQNGSFQHLSSKRKNFLMRQVESLRARLASLQPKLAGIALVAGLSMSLSVANAQTVFLENPTKTPFGDQTFIHDYTSWNVGSLADLDNDGDLDLINGNSTDNLDYFKNIGTASNPIFERQSGSGSNPFDGIVGNADYLSSAFADLDGDGDLDLAFTTAYYNSGSPINYYKNTGSISAPVFTAQTGTNNPFPLVSGYVGYAGFDMADIDGDGDFDAVVTAGNGGDFFFFKNNGTTSAPSFSETTSGSPFPNGIDEAILDYGDYAYPRFADLDGDGDLDLALGLDGLEPAYFKNTGTATAMTLTLQTGSNSPFNPMDFSWSTSAFGDLNDDGKLDFLLGTDDESVLVFNSGTSTSPKFNSATDFGYSDIKPAFADLDNDGDLDLLVNEYYGVNYYRNDGGTPNVYTQVTGTSSPLDAVNGYVMDASFVDIDSDGDLDIISGVSYGTIKFYQNIGNASAANFSLVNGTNSPFNSIDPGSYSSPDFVDLDNDGDLDLILGNSNENDLEYYQNNGSTSSPSFVAIPSTSTNFPLNGISSYYGAFPAFADVDGDGDLDALISTGEYYDDVFYFFQNNGTASAPSFSRVTGSSNPFNDLDISGNDFSPVFVDMDGDSDMDLYYGNGRGNILFYENKTNTPTAVRSATNVSFGASIEAYPNPVNSVLNFSLNDAIGSEMNVSVLTATGVQLFQTKAQNNGMVMSLDVASLEQGMYLLRLEADGKVAVTRFVKQ
jgi:hypothetical protein